MKRLVVGALAVVALGACASTTKVMESWQGHNANELLASWGPPQQVFSDGRGGRVFVYTSQRSWTTQGSSRTHTNIQLYDYGDYISGTATSYTTYTPSKTYGYTASRTFWINKHGVIYNWAWKGL